jgi:DNA-binding CsgD family transcriptional regulator
VSPALARGLRIAVLAAGAQSPPDPSRACGPASLVFDAAGRLTQSTPGALDEGGQRLAMGLPLASAVIGALVAAAWRYASGATDVLPATRIRLAGGEWVVLRAAPLAASDGSASGVVVTVDEARPPEVVPLLAAAFDLTSRERDVTLLILQGADTRAIASTLHVSSHTVQDHLKSIFDKTGVRSRRELLAYVFFDQYVPRLGGALSPSGSFLI